MKRTIKVAKEFDLKELHVKAGVRYWEDTEINGTCDTEDGELMPCVENGNWCPIIEIETGKIKNWENGKTADVHYKVCDAGEYWFKDVQGEKISTDKCYVPDCMCPNGDGYGDYIIMTIDKDGMIKGWKPDFDDLFEKED